jgi:serine/threonine-protein kinase
MVVPAGPPPWADPDAPDYPSGRAGHGRAGRGSGARRGGGGGGDEPFLQRWLFSRRLAYVAGGVAAVLAIAFLAWWLAGGADMPVPSVTGLTEAQAVSTLRTDGFTARIGPTTHDNNVPAGDVASYSPSGSAPKGATITLTISSGPVVIKIPSVTGQTFAGAVALLRKAGLTVSDQPQKVGTTGNAAIGSVAGTTPPAGTSWPANKTVYVQVIAGESLPNLVGQDAQQIQSWAQQNNINLVTQQATSDQQAGIITAQSPAPGTVITPGETVTVTVSSGPPTVSVPNVSGQTIDQATQALEQAGFQVSAHRFGFGQKVFYYNPTGTAQRGSTVQVWYGL